MHVRAVAGSLPSGTQLLVSGAADHSLRVWAVHQGAAHAQHAQQGGSTHSAQAKPQGSAPPWQQLAVLHGHAGPVTALAVHPLPASERWGRRAQFLLVSTAGDQDVRVWVCSPSPMQGGLAAVDGVQGEGRSGADAVAAAYGQTAWVCSQQLHVGTQIQQALALSQLPGLPDWCVHCLLGFSLPAIRMSPMDLIKIAFATHYSS